MELVAAEPLPLPSYDIVSLSHSNLPLQKNRYKYDRPSPPDPSCLDYSTSTGSQPISLIDLLGSISISSSPSFSHPL